MRIKRAASVLLAAWSCAAPLLARSGGVEDEWVRGGRNFDGLPGRPSAQAVAGNLAGGGALAELSAVNGAQESPDKPVEKKVPAPEKKSGYWQYNDYSHSTGESIGMLALDIVAWVLAPIVLVAGIIGALFTFLLR